jgi:[acyl-carrier-protein] S-malonyltransferase
MNSFLFPGQGSQSPGMGSFLYDNFKTAQVTFEEASDAINLNLKKLCFSGSVEELALTENTQPALLTVSTATARVLTKDLGVKPSITAGHSIGEYSSFVLGNVLKFSDAIRAVRLRGQAMQSAVPVGHGGMTATLGLTEEQVMYLCKWVIENSGYAPLSPANFNCDGQIVISGNLKALKLVKR